MRVLVTGANGFVGRHLCLHLRACGDEVVEAHGPPAGARSPGDLTMDLVDPGSVRAAVEAARPEAIIHLAGFSSVGKSHRDPGRVFAVNALGAVHLLVATCDVAPKARVLLIGSGEMYGALPAGTRASEDSPLRPLTPYAASKVAAEVAGFQASRATGLEVIGVRPFNHIGAGQAPHFAVPSFARQIEAIRLGRAAPVLKTGDLSPVRDFSHVDDVAQAYRMIALKGEAGEAYNVCSGEGRTIRSLVEEMLQLAGVHAALELDRSRLRPAELPSSIGDPSKLRRLGWSPSRSIGDGLRGALAEAASDLRSGSQPSS